MRPILSIQIFLLLFSFNPVSVILASDSIEVEPGTGTLQSAISKYGGDVVYQLRAGELYVLDGSLNVVPQVLGGSGKTLTIVGEETEGMPAIVQVGRTRQGAPEKSMFSCSANLTLKSLFLLGKDANGAFCEEVISMNAPIRLEVNECVIDPAGTRRTFNGGATANGSVMYLTNSQIYRNGTMDSPNDGGWLGGMQWDTLWVENNTLVSSGQDFIGGSFQREPNNQFIWVNHNTIMWHDVWIKKSFNDQNFYFTNNLLHDESLFPELPRWYPFFPDFEQGNNLLCQAAIDTLESGGIAETLPSERRLFWEYNLMYNSPELQKVPKYAADHGMELTYLLPMVWDEDVPLSYTGGIPVGSFEDSCRENRILSDKINWPHMKYKHNWYDLDPLYNDSTIYALSDSAGQYILGFYRGQFWNEPDAPAVKDLPSYNWDIDRYHGYGPADLPQVWPRFDASYTHSDLLTASLEGLPLGDLNWYPAQKFQWYANKKMIEAHVLALNEEKFVLQVPDSISYRARFVILDQEGNPIEGAMFILDGDTLEKSDPFGVIEFDTLSGTYSYSASATAFKASNGQFTIKYAAHSSTIILRHDAGTGASILSDLNVRLYPNPAHEYLMIETDRWQNTRLEVFNILGSKVLEETLVSERTSIELGALSQGIYLVRIWDAESTYFKNLMIHR